ncbi:hypothetical protein [Rhodoferax lacus]|uniref:hypothetical protein n=1 Tax=Rhodoferax lacus TaxID=2184758 RepID=UPI0011C14C4C|nr:hypothetical protein [Rhodoferax lacus]
MATDVDGRWHLGIGDPTVIGWVTVAAYGVAALLCYRCNKRYARTEQGQFWLVLTTVMLAFGINKQLDLQTWLTEIGRDAAFEYGWYGRRRVVQALFIAGLLISALLMRDWLSQKVSGMGKYVRRASMGLLVLGLFVLIRATSFHHIDEILGFSLDGLSINEVLELSGIFIVIWASSSRLWNIDVR